MALLRPLVAVGLTPVILSPPQLLVALAMAALVAIAAGRSGALSVTGTAAAAAVGFLIIGFGGWQPALALLLFFGTSSALSRWRSREKEQLGFEKGGRRDAGQVLANGGVAAAAVVAALIFPEHAWLHVAALAALSTANADTWATEIGALAQGGPRMITTFRPAPKGASGAVSGVGTGAAVLGALLIAAVAAAWSLGTAGVAAVAVGGFAGSMVDSMLGGTVQVQYRCIHCFQVTEQRVHCGYPAAKERGVGWIGNDIVNLLATVAGALVAAAVFLLIRGNG